MIEWADNVEESSITRSWEYDSISHLQDDYEETPDYRTGYWIHLFERTMNQVSTILIHEGEVYDTLEMIDFHRSIHRFQEPIIQYIHSVPVSYQKSVWSDSSTPYPYMDSFYYSRVFASHNLSEPDPIEQWDNTFHRYVKAHSFEFDPKSCDLKEL